MIFTRLLWAASAIVSYTAASPMPATDAAAVKCVEGVFIIAARGTDSTSTDPLKTDPNFADIKGMANIANALIKSVGQGSFLQAVPYPASGGVGYPISMNAGVKAAQKMIKNYISQCKATVTPRIIVLGDSQGAQVMTTALIGGVGHPSLGAMQKFITGGALFASPSFVVDFEPIDAGNATTSGIFALSQSQETTFNNVYGKKVRDYCIDGDKFCASGTGPDNAKIHGEEEPTFQQNAIDFLLTLV